MVGMYGDLLGIAEQVLREIEEVDLFQSVVLDFVHNKQSTL